MTGQPHSARFKQPWGVDGINRTHTKTITLHNDFLPVGSLVSGDNPRTENNSSSSISLDGEFPSPPLGERMGYSLPTEFMKFF